MPAVAKPITMAATPSSELSCFERDRRLLTPQLRSASATAPAKPRNKVPAESCDSTGELKPSTETHATIDAISIRMMATSKRSSNQVKRRSIVASGLPQAAPSARGALVGGGGSPSFPAAGPGGSLSGASGSLA